MLSFFPLLFTYQEFAPFLLRITLGAVLVFWSYKRLKSRNSPFSSGLGIIEGIIGILLVIGFLVQIASLISAIIFLIKLIKKIQTKSLFTDGVNYYFILLVISLALLVLGPGRFAFDLPL